MPPFDHDPLDLPRRRRAIPLHPKCRRAWTALRQLPQIPRRAGAGSSWTEASDASQEADWEEGPAELILIRKQHGEYIASLRLLDDDRYLCLPSHRYNVSRSVWGLPPSDPAVIEHMVCAGCDRWCCHEAFPAKSMRRAQKMLRKVLVTHQVNQGPDPIVCRFCSIPRRLPSAEKHSPRSQPNPVFRITRRRDFSITYGESEAAALVIYDAIAHMDIQLEPRVPWQELRRQLTDHWEVADSRDGESDYMDPDRLESASESEAV